MSHIADWWLYYLIFIFDSIIDFFIGWIVSRDEVIFIEVGIVWSS